MRTKYGVTEHHYPPLISPALYQQVQDVADGYHKKPHKKITESFILRGLITCAHCGCLATPERHKGRYIYYSCTNAKDLCQKIHVREELLVESLTHYFDHMTLNDEQIDDVTAYLKKIHESESLFHTESLTVLRKEQDRIQKRLSQM
jgi:site-specific DNA recombinase